MYSISANTILSAFLAGPSAAATFLLVCSATTSSSSFFSKRKHKHKHKYTTSAFLHVCAGTKSSSLIFTKCKHKYRHKHKYPTAAQQHNIGDRPTTISCFLYILMQFLRHIAHGFVDIYISWFVLFICIYVRGQSNFFLRNSALHSLLYQQRQNKKTKRTPKQT